MKKIFILLILNSLLLSISSQIINTWDYCYIKSYAKFRTLNIFINVIYDVNPQYNTYPSNDLWGEAYNEGVNNESIPPYLLDLLDTTFNPLNNKGKMTLLYQESSFDSLQITGDFVIVNIKESRILNDSLPFKSRNIINAAIDLININGLQTIYGHNAFEDYYYSNAMDSTLGGVNFYFRNITKNYGGYDMGQGSSGNSYNFNRIKIENKYYNFGYITSQCVGTSNIALSIKSITTHELSHALFGSNYSHTSGGNHHGSLFGMPFFTIQGGYGLMGGFDSGLVSTNGYERLRMHWKNPASPYYISAKDTLNIYNLNSDISKSDGNTSFILRDFITSGDVIRIKLPYKDSIYSSNQYIWLENHQIDKNNKLDFLMYSNTASCRPKGSDGIYSYYQVGRDTLTGSFLSVYRIHERDNLKIIPAEGYWDFIINNETYPVNCIAGGGLINYTHIRTSENPFNGYQDQERTLFPPDDEDTLSFFHEKMMWRKKIAESINDSLPRLGDNRDAFHYYSKINMGTNPSTCNAKTYYNSVFYEYFNGVLIDSLFLYDSHRNNQTTYLTGLSIEMIPLLDNTYRVNIRWDDYDVRNDAIWTGNICLKESLFLNSGKTIYLKQNKTVALPFRNPETGYFADFTNFRCDTNSIFVLNPNATLLIDEKSIFNIDSSASFIMMDSSFLQITGGSVCYVKKGSNLVVHNHAEIIVDSLSVLYIEDTVKIAPNASIIVEPGGKLIINGGTLTNYCSNSPWQGIVVEGNESLSQNATEQGIVVLNNATIENAICGIKVGDTTDLSKNGGIVYATNTTFKNCKNAVFFAPYQNMNNNVEFANRSKFTESVFLVDNDFYSTGMFFDSHVKLLGVNGISFTGCRFTNEQITPNPSTKRYVSSGISAINSGFSVQPSCSSNIASGEVCAIPYVDVPSVFSGLDYGIVIHDGGALNQVKISSTQFINNYFGVYVSGLHNVKLLNNDFEVGNNRSNFVSNPMGAYFEYASNFRIEENRFSKNANFMGSAVGLKIKTSGMDNNVVYKNQFNDLNTAQKFIGGNFWFAIPENGLKSICNDHFNSNNFDIFVESDPNSRVNGINMHQNMIYNYNGIDQVVGAGNKFSNFQYVNMQYNNEGNFLFYYFNPNNPDECLTNYSSSTISQKIAPENPCPSKINGLYPSTINAELTSVTLEYGNLKYNYNQLIDAGNTPELIRLIQDVWSEDVWNLRTELLGQSPFLSQQAILSVAEENLLPPALLLEICIANPDATKNEEFLKKLRYGIPTPLPEYMINLIRASWENKTLRTDMEEQLSAFKTYRDEYQNYKTEILLSDTIYNYTDIINHLDSRGSYSDYLSMAEIAINQNDFVQANLYLDILKNNHSALSDEKSLEVENFRDYIAIRESIFINNRTIYNLDSPQIAALEFYASSNNYRGAILARNILCFLYDICIEDVPDRPKILSVGGNATQGHATTLYIASIQVLPNPAHEYASFIWDMKSYDKSSILYIYDQNGKIIVTQPIDTKQGQWVWDLRNTPSGVYVYTLKSDQLTLYSGKVIVSK